MWTASWDHIKPESNADTIRMAEQKDGEKCILDKVQLLN